MNKIAKLLDEYVLFDINKLIQKYSEINVKDILNIMQKNYKKIIVMDLEKSQQPYLIDIRIFIVSTLPNSTNMEKYIFMIYYSNFDNYISHNHIKKNKQICEKIMYLLKYVKKKYYKVPMACNFTTKLLNLLQAYSIESYNISFTFEYHRSILNKSYNYHNILTFFPNEIQENITTTYHPNSYFVINIKN
jgi:hypothetical protein